MCQFTVIKQEASMTLWSLLLLLDFTVTLISVWDHIVSLVFTGRQGPRPTVSSVPGMSSFMTLMFSQIFVGIIVGATETLWGQIGFRGPRD